MKNIIILTLLLLVNTIGFAQSHDMSAGSTCKLIKTSVNTESHICPACAANDKKEKDAKIAEVKKRNDKIWADAKIKKDAEQKAYQDKLAAEAFEKKQKEKEGKLIITNSKNEIIGKSFNLNEKEQIEFAKYSTKINGDRKINAAASISILYDGIPIFTSSEYSAIYRVSEKALIFVAFKPSINMSCDEKAVSNSGIFINEKGEPISISHFNKIAYASEYNNVLTIIVQNDKCYPDNESSNSLMNSSYRGRTTYKYNLLDLSLISSRPTKAFTNCPCPK